MSDQLYRQYEDTLRELAAVTAEREMLKSRVLELESMNQRNSELADNEQHSAQLAEGRVTELTHNQRIQDSATAAVMERAERAEAEAKALRKDAERYRWLCADLDPTSRAIRGHIFNRMSVMGKGAIDAAIDAAIAESSLDDVQSKSADRQDGVTERQEIGAKLGQQSSPAESAPSESLERELRREADEFIEQWMLSIYEDNLCDRLDALLATRPPEAAQEGWLAKIEIACRKSKLFNLFMEQNFWHAHHLDIVWRFNGEDVREQADWLKDVWYAVRQRTPGEPTAAPQPKESERE